MTPPRRRSPPIIGESPQRAGEILVLAGPNGGGKSSVGGAALRSSGHEYFNPDEATREILAADPSLSVEQANSRAWHMGRQYLERAIERRTGYAFETTLGGATMTGLLHKAANVGMPVRMWFVALRSADLHIQRVRERYSSGGHDIPEAKVRSRYESSRVHLIDLLPHLTELRLFDNTAEGDPAAGGVPRPVEIFHLTRGAITDCVPLSEVPQWAKPILAAALSLTTGLPIRVQE